jgi:Homeodomain-like domain
VVIYPARRGADNGRVPESAEQAVRRRALARAAGQRRDAVAVLRLAEATAGYAAGQVGNGLGPEQARQAALDAAGELADMAATLRRLARPGPGDRRALAVELAADGLSQREIADRLGLSLRAVWGYLQPDRRGRWAGQTDQGFDSTGVESDRVTTWTLAELRHHWGDAYVIEERPGWRARRRDGRGGWITARDAEALLLATALKAAANITIIWMRNGFR